MGLDVNEAIFFKWSNNWHTSGLTLQNISYLVCDLQLAT